LILLKVFKPRAHFLYCVGCMAVIYRCKNCGTILYTYRYGNVDKKDLFYGVLPPGTVIDMYKGVCPKCGRRLEKPSVNDVVVSVGIYG